MAARHPQRRVLLRTRLQRTGGRLRPCGAPHPRGPRRRRLDRQRAEAVVDRRRQSKLYVARRSHRSGSDEACRHQRADGRSAFARRHHPPEHGAVRQDLQRAVLRQRAGAGANMVGAVNNGWKVITDALAAERVMIGATRMAGLERAFDHLTEYLKTAVVGGKALKNDPVIRDRIGALAADLEVARQFQVRNARLVEQGRSPEFTKLRWARCSRASCRRGSAKPRSIFSAAAACCPRFGQRPDRRDGTTAAPFHHGHDRRRHQRNPAKRHRTAGAGVAPMNQERSL